MKKYRVLVVVRHPVGGIRTFFRYVYTKFDASLFEFTFIAPDTAETGVMIEELRSLNVASRLLDRASGNREMFWEVTRILRSGNFDMVHSHGFSSAVCSVLGACLSRVPHLVTCHDVFTQNQLKGLSGMAKKWALGAILATASCVHCVGIDARNNLLQYLRMLRPFKRKVVCIRNGIDVDGFLSAHRRDLRTEFGLEPETFLIGFLGRFMSQKGFRYLVDAMEEIIAAQTKPRPVVLAFGGGGFVREDRADIQRRGLSDSIVFVPFVRNVAETLKGLDLVAMPSLWEACPLLPMEAMVAGVPLIGTDCVGLREVIADTPARTVRAGDSRSLAVAIADEMRSPSVIRAKAFSAQAASRFRVSERARELEGLMLALLQGRPLRAWAEQGSEG